MKLLTEEQWQKMKGQMFHLRIIDAWPWDIDTLQVDAEILELEHTFSFNIKIKED